MNKLRAAAYCRVSTDKEDQANSLESQRKYFTEYIAKQAGWVLDKVYYDEGISGTQTKKRAGFNAMIEEAMSGGIDLILTKEVCRFARNTIDTLLFTRKLKEKGVGVIFTIDNIDTRDSDGELRLTLMAGIAQEESRKTSERVKWGQKRRMEQGVVFGRDLLGYTVIAGTLAVNEAEAPIVQAIFHKYADEGKGTHVIARELVEEGMYPKRARQWSATAILRVLRNEKYVGDLCQKKTYTPDYLTHAKKYNRGKEEMVYLEDHHTPLIGRDLWNRTQEELSRRSHMGETREKFSSRYWCSGKIYCGLCGQRYVSRTKCLKNKRIYKAWRCYAAASHGSAGFGTAKDMECRKKMGCDNNSVNERALLACMHYCISQLQVDTEALKKEIFQELKALEDVSGRKSGTGVLQEKIEVLEQKKRKAIDLMLEGVITQEDLKRQTAWYEEQRKKFLKQLAGVGAADLDLTRQQGQYFVSLDEIMTFDERNKELYRELLDKMVIYNGNMVEIWLKNVPYGIRLVFASHGRNESYTTDILAMEITGKDCMV